MTPRLIILLHGVGSSAADMAPFAAALAETTGAEAIALDGPEAFDMSPSGRQWFSVRGVTEAGRPARVARALPALLATIEDLRIQRGLQEHEVSLAGFSQGAILALAAAAGGASFGSVIAVAGRLAAPVMPATADVPKIAFLHDRLDPVMPIALAREARTVFADAGYATEAVESEGYGHSIGPVTLRAAIRFLNGAGETINQRKTMS